MSIPFGASAVIASTIALAAIAPAALAERVPDTCIEVQTPVRTADVCRGDARVPMFRTVIKSRPLPGCPASILIAYVDPIDGQPHGAIAAREGRAIETCGAGPRSVSVVEERFPGAAVTVPDPGPPPDESLPVVSNDAVPAPPPVPVRPVRWNAVAASLGRLKDGRATVAIGYSGAKESAAEATASAMAECRKYGGTACEVKGPWSQGCVFITLGTGTGTKGASWYSASVKDDALKRCQAAGYKCREPIGGCVE